MTALSDAAVPTATTSKSALLYVGGALLAAVAFLAFAAVVSDDARVGDNSTSNLSTYVTGDSQNLPSTSDYLSH